MCNKNWYLDDAPIQILPLRRVVCIHRLTPRMIPPGMDPDDLTLECEDDLECPKNRKKRRGKPKTLARKLEWMAAWGKRFLVACVHRLKPGIVPPIINPDDVILACRDDPYCPKRRKKRKTSSRKR